MPGSTRLLFLGSVAALAVGLAAGSVAAGAGPAAARDTHPAALFTLKISGIDRDGTPVTPVAYVESTSGTSYLNGGTSVKVPAGEYVVGAAIWRAADGNSQTLVADQVHVTGNTHVTLSAKGAVAVQASLSATGVSQSAQTIGLCVGKGIEENELAGYLVGSLGSPGVAYVKPMSSKALTTVYQTYWQNPAAPNTGPFYEVAGAFKGGIPAHPVYHASPASMAKVTEQLRSRENVTPLRAVIETYDGCGTTTLNFTPPTTYTDYRTPGDWSTNLNYGTSSAVQRDIWTSRDYRAGHSYREVFGSAVAGPSPDYAETEDSSIVYSPVNQFADPQVKVGFDCEGRATVTLTRGKTQVAKQKLTFCGSSDVFSKQVKKTGWYTLTAAASRWNPSGSLPNVLLSSQVTLAWHFKFAPVTGHPINAEAEPVTVSRFVPQGLTAANEAPRGSTTSIKVYVLRGGGQPVATPRYKLRTPKFQVSFDGGTTWQTQAATWHGGYWVIQVANPQSGGLFVSLRSTQADAHGDSTTETILRAYAVPNVDGGL
jgi:hypothetical protein